MAPDQIGQKYGRLTVIGRAESHRDTRGKARSVWRVRCECGALKQVQGRYLLRGTTQSCGCLGPGRRVTHGATAGGVVDPHYKAWANMLERCRNARHPSYPSYGGRGISVCAEWATSYESFIRDVGRRPTPKHSLDRIDNDRGYEPGNVRWATDSQQMSNRRGWARRPEAGGAE